MPRMLNLEDTMRGSSSEAAMKGSFTLLNLEDAMRGSSTEAAMRGRFTTMLNLEDAMKVSTTKAAMRGSFTTMLNLEDGMKGRSTEAAMKGSSSSSTFEVPAWKAMPPAGEVAKPSTVTVLSIFFKKTVEIQTSASASAF